MSKPFSTIGSATAGGSKIGGGVLLFLVLAVVAGIVLLTNGVPPLVGVVIAVVGAFVIDKALFGAWK